MAGPVRRAGRGGGMAGPRESSPPPTPTLEAAPAGPRPLQNEGQLLGSVRPARGFVSPAPCAG